MAAPKPPAPYHTITPRMVVANVEAAVEFLQRVFCAQAEVAVGRPREVLIGDSVVLVSSTAERQPYASFLYVYVDDTDATYQRAMEAGATSIELPLETPYGDRRAMFQDTFGNIYQVAHRRPSGD